MLLLPLIVGAALLIAGIVLCFVPLAGFLEIGEFIGISMIVFSVTGLVKCINDRSFRADFFLTLLSLFAGIFLLHDPLIQFMTDAFVLYMAAVWLLIEGGSTIWLAISSKKQLFSRWWLVLISGILNVLLGLFSFFNPRFGMVALGLMVAFYFLNAGLSMILCALAFRQ